ncbi:sugar-binding transcriptional regulator [Cellulomonas denverensis]|uniref:Transcriptional regulator n=1 Tax=Cellulomonas denverensis TaxID=264297 RepID=A0A7X6QYI4_9CELL|nr:sugar-binding domain-containing protein [Cellulomonas denverensis]NKY22148.1 transcriptional regulator [Cellulomonas denverensis]
MSTSEEWEQMVRAARRYYLDDAPKKQIGEELGVSRFKVARLLEQARDQGVVTITIQDAGLHVPTLSAAVADHLGLSRATVIESTGSDAEVRRQVGEAAAELLGDTLRAGEVLGLAWGRTLTAMSASMPPLPPMDVVQLTGAIGTDLADSPVEVVRRVALRSGGSARPIFAPLVVDSPETAEALRRQPDVAAALELFDDLTTAVVSVGSWDPPESQLLRTIGEPEQAELLGRGVVAEVASILVSDAGDPVAPDFQARCLTITAEQMRRIPRVVAAAGGARKARALAAVVRAGLVTELVCDRALAEAVLGLPGVPPVARGTR